MDKPLCKCHGVDMYWHKDRRRMKGGSWRCRVKRKERDARRWQSYYYERVPFAVLARKNMAARRAHALTRRRERQQRRAES